jgi:hypothetical protein
MSYPPQGNNVNVPGQVSGDTLYFNGTTGKWERTGAFKIVGGLPTLGANLDANNKAIISSLILALKAGTGVLAAAPSNVWSIGDDGTQINLWDNTGAKGFRIYDIVNTATRFAISGAGVMTLAGATVSYGANDSGGAGYKVLRVPN